MSHESPSPDPEMTSDPWLAARQLQPDERARLLAALPDQPLPPQIGAFRIIRILGRGGMGIVYEAEQERPRRRVALKVLRPGMMSAPMLRRFEYEADVLARLEHPGIARIFEVGVADAGLGPQPYFAMELVEGKRLDEYMKEARPTVEQRLRLLIDICEAVHHAHTKGVIHRDLKPGNILITPAGQAKVLDFGVAKATNSDVQSTTLHTESGQLVGTLPYMAPEQASGNVRDLDTSSDVYALGVIAYELLSGQLPYAVENKSLHEAVRVICEIAPIRLSNLNSELRGDIETVVGKALEKEQTRRYRTAGELAADVQRYLQYEPITARPPSAMYQLNRFARRHKTLVAAVVAIVLVLLVGVIATSLQAVRARSAEREAKAGRAEAERQRAIAQRLLAESYASSAQMARARGDMASAITNYRKAIDAGHPDPSSMRARIIEVLISLSDYKQARLELDALKAIPVPSPHDAKRRLIEGRILLHEQPMSLIDLLRANPAPSKQEQRATAMIREAIDTGVDELDEALARADLAETFPEARKWLSRALELDPYNPNTNTLLGAMELALGNVDEAALRWRIAAVLAPDDASPLLGIAAAHAMRGEVEALDGALEAFESRLGTASVATYRDYLMLIAKHVRAQKRDEPQVAPGPLTVLTMLARVSASPATTQTPVATRFGSLPAFRITGSAAMSLLRSLAFNQHPSALEAAQRLVGSCPNAETHRVLAELFFELDRYDDAEREMIRALESPSLTGDRRTPLYHLAVIQMQGAREHARVGDRSRMPIVAGTLRRAMEYGLIPKSLGPADMVGMAGETGDLDLAREMLARELHRDPNNRGLAVAKIQLEFLAGNYGAAILCADHLLDRWPGDQDAQKLRAAAVTRLGRIGVPSRAVTLEEYEQRQPFNTGSTTLPATSGPSTVPTAPEHLGDHLPSGRMK
jgi:tetratricopeptide (TPR) repeat protein/predicted Ser/Thr protein kinase